jgi:hypothetical protein
MRKSFEGMLSPLTMSCEPSLLLFDGVAIFLIQEIASPSFRLRCAALNAKGLAMT